MPAGFKLHRSNTLSESTSHLHNGIYVELNDSRDLRAVPLNTFWTSPDRARKRDQASFWRAVSEESLPNMIKAIGSADATQAQ
jgi:hypothetical protein